MMVEKQFIKNNGSIIVFDPDIVNITIKKNPDNTFMVIMDGIELFYNKFTNIDRIFKELYEFRLKKYDVDKDKIRD